MTEQPRKMVSKQPRHTSHVFHLLMTIITAGIWGVLVWLPMTILNKMRKEKVVTKVHY